jgi:DDE domain
MESIQYILPILEAYEDEVAGAAYFDGLAVAYPQQTVFFERCAALERETATQLSALLQKYQLTPRAQTDRGIAAAQAFFRKALSSTVPRWPRKITLDGHKQSHLALRYLRREDPKWKFVQVRSSQYLNNLIEQDHRAVKRRCASMGGFKSFGSAAITLAGIELAHRIRKRQFSLGRNRYRNFGSLMQIWDRALAL